MTIIRTIMSHMVLFIVLPCVLASYQQSSYERTHPTYHEASSYERTQPEHYDTSYDGQTHYLTLSRLNEVEQSLQQILYKVGKLEGLTSNIKKPVTYHSPLNSGASTQLMYLLMNKMMMNRGDEYKDKEPITDCNKDGYEWVDAFGNCIKIHHEELTWGEARLKCIKEGADLVVLDTEAKNEALFQRLDFFDYAEWFMGLSDTGTEGTFKWVNGELVDNTFEDWAPTEPNDSPSDGDCAVLWFRNGNGSGKWYDRDCHSDNKFVCESKRKAHKDDNSYGYTNSNKYDGRYHSDI